MTPEAKHAATMQQVQELIRRARPDQIRRLIEDIRNSGRQEDASAQHGTWKQ